MTFSAGTRLGPYEVSSPLGAGGMGEVYRARDPRLGRDVAIKVLPSDLSSDPGRLKRFEKEARSASALNHPNIVTIYEIGQTDSHSYIAMELVEGKTLRELLFAGPLPVKRVLQLSTQIADGLARAHEAGIVHRDLKPENVMVTKDGRVKILDFGLAKLTDSGLGSGEGTNLPTETGTDAGIILGTLGYMSPEQASGQHVDFRSDQFSFGSILYEMATGKRSFQKGAAADTLSAILHKGPRPVAEVNPEAPAPLRWIIERCLAKDPEDRYDSTKDLARELASVETHLSGAASTSESARHIFAGRRRAILPAFLALALVVLGAVLVLKRPGSLPPTAPSLRFSQLTFDDQAVVEARFAPDGETFVYGAYRLAEGQPRPADLFMARVGSPESRSLGIPEARICSISTGGNMGFLLGGGDTPAGTLAEAALAGGAPRNLLENVRHADWSPDGKTLAVVRAVEGRDRLEFPAEKVLYESPATLLLRGSIHNCRVSPKGDLVAFFEREAGQLSLVDDHGKLTKLFQAGALVDFDWSPRGDEVWYAKLQEGATELHAVTRAGRDRFLTSLPGDFQLHDVSPSGRILLEKWTQQFKVLGRLGGDAAERDLAYRSATEPVDLSADGSQFLFNEVESGWTKSTVYLRATGTPPVSLGQGFARALSPDGKWALATRNSLDSELVLLPTGAGEPRRLPKGTLKAIGLANWLPDGNKIVFAASADGERSRLYVQDVAGGPPKSITPEGVTFFWRGGTFVSPDGKLVVGWNLQPQPIAPTGQEGFALYPVDGGDPQSVRGLAPREFPIQWSEDGRLLVARPGAWISPDQNRRVFLLDPSSGERELSIELSPPPLEPPLFLRRVVVARDGKSYVRVAERYSSNLFVLDGVQ